MHADPLAHILEQGADVIVRAPWKGARWLGKDSKPFDILAALTAAEGTGVLDTPIWIGRKKAPPPALRLVASRKSAEAAEMSRVKARRAAQREGNAISEGTLAAAGWVIFVTSLDTENFPAGGIGELYRARWRIEMAFKRLKSLIGLSATPSEDAAVAKTWILAHLLMALLLEPHTSAPGISPRMANRARNLALGRPCRQGAARGAYAHAPVFHLSKAEAPPSRTAAETMLSSNSSHKLARMRARRGPMLRCCSNASNGFPPSRERRRGAIFRQGDPRSPCAWPCVRFPTKPCKAAKELCRSSHRHRAVGPEIARNINHLYAWHGRCRSSPRNGCAAMCGQRMMRASPPSSAKRPNARTGYVGFRTAARPRRRG